MRYNKSIINSIFIFATIFMAILVYAAFTTDLSFGGTVVRPANVNLEIIDADFSSSAPAKSQEESVYIDTTTYKTLNIDVKLLQPGDRRVIQFKIQNTETVPTTLGALQTNDPEVESGIVINWPNLNGVTIEPGQTMPSSGYYEIEIEWDVDKYDAISDWHTFSATIAYAQ